MPLVIATVFTLALISVLFANIERVPKSNLQQACECICKVQ